MLSVFWINNKIWHPNYESQSIKQSISVKFSEIYISNIASQFHLRISIFIKTYFVGCQVLLFFAQISFISLFGVYLKVINWLFSSFFANVLNILHLFLLFTFKTTNFFKYFLTSQYTFLVNYVFLISLKSLFVRFFKSVIMMVSWLVTNLCEPLNAEYIYIWFVSR